MPDALVRCTAGTPELHWRLNRQGRVAPPIWSSVPLRIGETIASCPGKKARCDGKCCAVVPTNREKNRATIEEKRAVSCLSSSGSSQDPGSQHPESLAGL